MTGIFGKWHNGSQWPYHPLARGFDTFWGYTSGHWGEYFDAPLEHNGVMKTSKGYIVDVLTEKAAVSPKMAVRLGKLCGNGAGVWLRMQAACDLWDAEREVDVSNIPTLKSA